MLMGFSCTISSHTQGQCAVNKVQLGTHVTYIFPIMAEAYTIFHSTRLKSNLVSFDMLHLLNDHSIVQTNE